jgi:hypothetical protein
MLDAFENAGPATLEEVLEAFIAPTIALRDDPVKGGLTFVKLMGRLHMETNYLPAIIAGHFADLVQRFHGALRAALPEVPETELPWRIHFAIGAMAHALAAADRPPLAHVWSGDRETIQHRLVAFLSAGFRAPVREVHHVR